MLGGDYQLKRLLTIVVLLRTLLAVIEPPAGCTNCSIDIIAANECSQRANEPVATDANWQFDTITFNNANSPLVRELPKNVISMRGGAARNMCNWKCCRRSLTRIVLVRGAEIVSAARGERRVAEGSKRAA